MAVFQTCARTREYLYTQDRKMRFAPEYLFLIAFRIKEGTIYKHTFWIL